MCSLSTLTYVLETDDSTNQELLKIVHRTGTTEIEMQKKELRYFRNIQEIHGSESVIQTLYDKKPPGFYN